MKRIITSTILAAAAMTGMAVTPLWLRDVKISPDGSRIAFTYKGDIYTVPAAGGNALRGTSQPSLSLIPIAEPTRLLRIGYAGVCLKKKIGGGGGG
ncbi:MAG: DPP IV N-terminal domain-containing protein, partial [Duncaniella sp.]|nr:DPP IV N-terminal domain-containing protein [Duncaniella sp.]